MHAYLKHLQDVWAAAGKAVTQDDAVGSEEEQLVQTSLADVPMVEEWGEHIYDAMSDSPVADKSGGESSKLGVRTTGVRDNHG